MKLNIATGNNGKVEEIEQRIEHHGLEIEVRQIEVDVEEIQELDVEDVAPRKAEDSYQAAVEAGEIEEGEPLIVEDTGFYVESLDGFPGSMAKHFAVTVGAEKLVELMKDVEDRSAYFKSVIAFYDGEKVESFAGMIEGRVPEHPRGETHPHLPYNSLAIPEGEDETLAENKQLKKENHHRNKALDSFLRWMKD